MNYYYRYLGLSEFYREEQVNGGPRILFNKLLQMSVDIVSNEKSYVT